MNIRRHLSRVALTLVLAGAAAPAAQASGPQLDDWFRTTSVAQTQVGIYPDDRAVIRGANSTGLGYAIGVYPDDRAMIRGANPTGLSSQVGIYSDDRAVIRGANPTGLGLEPTLVRSTGSGFEIGRAHV